MRILIANRGEIARRIIRTAARLGHETVAVYAEPDRGAPFVADATLAVHLGPADLSLSYLNGPRILDAAQRSGATAIHPGYGFLSENGDFAAAVVRAGLLWIGPHAQAIYRMGSKIEARSLAAAAGVPTIPGFDSSQKPAELALAAERIGYPVLVKAAAGGGGKGIRIVRERAGFAAALEEAAREAERSFANSDVIVERYIERARHIEVQIVGDRHGNVIQLGTRECSVQRRYQKLLEEAPAPNLPEATRAGLCDAACRLARSIGYDSAGTVEFVLDDASGEYFFLEMNTRLQVEHPVTEAITGLDLVELQLRCAAGEALPLEQRDVRFEGHAFEVRINAEDAAAGFAPQVGHVSQLRVPAGVRWESGVERGSVITPHYDAMLAKLIAHGPDRDAARRRLVAALDELLLGGLVTNTGFQRWLLEQAPVVEGRVTTRFLDSCELPAPHAGEDEAARLAAGAWVAARRDARTPGPWGALGPFRLTPHRPTRTLALRDRHGAVRDIDVADAPAFHGSHLVAASNGVERRFPVAVDLADRQVAINSHGQTHTFRVLSRSERWAPSAGAGQGAAEATRAPFPAIVTDTPVAAGDSVAAGAVVVVIEAMKMLHSLTARGPGVVRAVHVAVGEAVASNQVLVSFESELPADASSEGD